MSYPKVSIIVTIKGRRRVTARSLYSLFAHTAYRPLEVLLIDDRNPPEIQEVLEAQMNWVRPGKKLEVKIIRNKDDSKGVCHANNLGLAAATGEVIVIADNDIIYADRWLETAFMLLWESRNLGNGVQIVSLFNYFREKPEEMTEVLSIQGVACFRNNYATGCNLVFHRSLPQLWGGYFPVGVPDDCFVHEAFRQHGLVKPYLVSVNSFVQHIGADSSLDHLWVARSYNYVGDPKEDPLLPGNGFKD